LLQNPGDVDSVRILVRDASKVSHYGENKSLEIVTGTPIDLIILSFPISCFLILLSDS
jgi:hypothetical protein